jgi:hypothetical protein
MAIKLQALEPVPDSWLKAIEGIESGGDPKAIGDKGLARGLFQFHKAAWDDTTKLRKINNLPVYPFTKATNSWVSQEYAQTYLAYLRHRLSEKIGRPAMAHETWLAFNLGMTGFSRYKYQVALVPQARYDKAMVIYHATK